MCLSPVRKLKTFSNTGFIKIVDHVQPLLFVGSSF